MIYKEAMHALAKSLVTIVADFTTMRVLPPPTIQCMRILQILIACCVLQYKFHVFKL